MAHVDEIKIGAFCWAELSTTDQQGAKDFYTNLFGWTATDLPVGPDQVYTMLKIDEREVGAATTLRSDQIEQGVPSHWMLYIAVDNADAAAAKAKTLGAKVFVEPFDVFDAGRMTVLQDPTGAVFSIWQPIKSIGIRITEVPGTLCWADLMTSDQQAAATFYRSLFGWDLEAGTEHPDYLHITNQGQFMGGIPPVETSASRPSHWLAYFLVTQLETSIEQAKKDGGKVLVPAMDISKVGRFAVVQDPQGAAFALFQLETPAT
jgi:predicted enzyme related to lactoylglutathione lyase